MTRKFLSKTAILVPMTALALVAGMLLPLSAHAAKDAPKESAVVVLTASWCGTCREILPIVQKSVSSTQPGLPVVVLDVDAKSSPEAASQYGINVSGSEVPQVYLYKNSRTTLLFDGKSYKFGQSKQAEELIKSRLQSNF